MDVTEITARQVLEPDGRAQVHLLVLDVRVVIQGGLSGDVFSSVGHPLQQ